MVHVICTLEPQTDLSWLGTWGPMVGREEKALAFVTLSIFGVANRKIIFVSCLHAVRHLLIFGLSIFHSTIETKTQRRFVVLAFPFYRFTSIQNSQVTFLLLFTCQKKVYNPCLLGGTLKSVWQSLCCITSKTELRAETVSSQQTQQASHATLPK